jgi:hypothetical protein
MVASGTHGLGRIFALALALALALVGCGAEPPPAAALDAAAREAGKPEDVTQVAVQAAAGEGWARVVLVWPRPVVVRTTTDGRGLLIRFDRALEAPQLGGLPRRLSGWIDSVNAGHDSVLLLAALDVDFSVTVDGAQVIIDLRARRPDPGETVVIGG